MKLAFSVLAKHSTKTHKYAHLRAICTAVCVIAKNRKKIKYPSTEQILHLCKIKHHASWKIKYHCNTQQHKLKGKEQGGETGNVVHGQGLGSYSKGTGVFDPRHWQVLQREWSDVIYIF